MARAGDPGFLRLPRGTDELPCTGALPSAGDAALERRLITAQPARDGNVEADGNPARSPSPNAAHPSSLARAPLSRETPKVGAVCLNGARTDLSGGRSARSVPTG